jgi:hypothetical protein
MMPNKWSTRRAARIAFYINLPLTAMQLAFHWNDRVLLWAAYWNAGEHAAVIIAAISYLVGSLSGWPLLVAIICAVRNAIVLRLLRA